ncbi:MAG: response regulator [Pseudomonadota bacterium]
MNILVVDNDESNRKLLLEFIEMLGHECVTAGSGMEALAQFKEQEFGLILMDCKMPGMDGPETVRRMRAEKQASTPASVPIIGLSGEVTPENEAICLAAGMNRFVGKPFGLTQLEDVIEQHASETFCAGNKG